MQRSTATGHETTCAPAYEVTRKTVGSVRLGEKKLTSSSAGVRNFLFYFILFLGWGARRFPKGWTFSWGERGDPDGVIHSPS